MPQRVRTLLAGAACAAAWLIASSAVRSQAPDAPALRVLTTAPEGETGGIVTQASVRFSEPMVPLGGGAAIDRVPFVTIDPAIAAVYRWATTDTLVITPATARFPHATTVTITVDAGATAVSGRRLAAPRAFSFTTTPPRLIGAHVARGKDVPPRLVLRFDQPVRTEDLLDHVAVQTDPRTEPVAELSDEARARLARLDPEGLRQREALTRARAPVDAQPRAVGVRLAGGSAAEIPLSFDDPAMASHALVVTHRGARSPEGPLRRATPDSITVVARRLAVSGPTCDGPCSPDHVGLTIEGSAVDLHSALSLVDITDPAAERPLERQPVSGPWYAWPPFSFAALGYRLEPGHRYAARVEGSLESHDGQRLGAPWVSIFAVGERPSFLALASGAAGHVVWEAAAGPGVPVLTRNLADLRAGARSVPRREVTRGGDPAFAVPDAALRTVPVTGPRDGSVRETLIEVSSALSAKGLGVARLRVAPGADVPGTAKEPERSFPGPRRYTTDTVVQVTNLGLTVRGNSRGMALFATRLDTGARIPGAAVSLLDDRRRVLWRGRTGADGLVVATLTRATAEPAYAVVEHGDDTSFVAVRLYGGDDPEPGLQPVGLLFTDRGVYRPGEEVHVKALLQTIAPRGVVTPRAGTRVTLTLLRENQPLRQFTTTLGRTGGADWVVPIPAGSETDAYYALTMRRGGPDATLAAYDPGKVELATGLAIKAVRPAEFRMSAESSVAFADGVPTIESAASARDLSDVALGGAHVEWAVTRPEADRPPPFVLRDSHRDFSVLLSDPAVEEAYRRTPFTQRHEAQLDAEGSAAARFALPSGLAGRGVFAVATQVRDASSQVQGHENEVVVWPEAFLGLAIDSTGEGRAVRLAAWTPEGVPVNRVPVDVTFTVLDDMYADDRTVAPVRLQAQTGEAPVRLAVPETLAARRVRVDARASDEARAIMPSRTTLQPPRPSTPAPAPPPPPAGDGATPTLTMSLDREQYQPGDRARLRLLSNQAQAEVMVTIERGAVLSAHAITLAGGVGVLEFPIGASALEGLQARATMVLGRRSPCCGPAGADPGRPQAWASDLSVPIDAGAVTLDVAIDAPARARPGSRVPVRVRVRDRDGKPAAADVTLWAVDEGVLMLTGYTRPDPLPRIYRPEWPWLASSDTRDALLGRAVPVDPRDFVQTSSAERSAAFGVAELGDGASVRRDLRPLAFWSATVPTGADGVAEIQAALPDTLTTYRVMAVAVDTHARYGGAEAPMRVAKPVMARPALPRFLTRGDVGQLRTTVATASVAGAGTVQVESLTPTLLRIDGASQPITVTDGSRITASAGMEALAAGTARVRVTATIGEARDVIERDLPIVDGTLPETSAATGAAAPTATETIVLPAGIDPTAGGLSLDVRSTMLVGLSAAAEYVRDYPHQCAEQLASRALVLVLASAMPQTLSLPGGPTSAAARREDAQQALNALDAYRCDGGAAIGYWPGDCRLRSPYLTAYVLLVLDTAAAHGFAMPGDLRARAAAGLAATLATPAGPNAMDRVERALAIKVLADAGVRPVEALDAATTNLDDLPVFALAHLYDAARAIDATHPRVADLRRRIRNALTPGVSAHVEESAAGCGWCWTSNGKSTAIVLDALTRGGAIDAVEARAMTRWLLEARRRGTWRSTQENAWALLAMATYQRTFEREGVRGAATVSLGGRPVLQHRFDAARPSADRTVPMTEIAAALPSGSGPLTVAAEGGPVFYATRLALRMPARSAPPVEHGILVTRAYRPVGRGRDGAPATRFEAGDLVRVVLTVRLPESRAFVAITDALPAGFEVVDTTLATSAGLGTVDAAASPWGWRAGFDRTARYDRRVDFFATWLAAGTHETSYLARATTPGTFFAAPTTAEAMYEPEVAGRTAGATIVIR